MIELARWATEEEINDFNKWCASKNTNKDFFTSDWLVNNGDYFIKIHESYPSDIINFKINEVEDYNKNRVETYNREINMFNSYSKGKCICGGNNVLIKSQGVYYSFIGCDNFREQGFNHTKISQPYLYVKDIEQELSYLEIKTNYLNNLKKINNLPIGLKESVLCQYLIMNNQTLHADLESRYNLTRDAKIKSNSREKIIEKILKDKFETVLYQKGIMVKMVGERMKLKFPDFVCITDSNCYIFEQKKNIGLINMSQSVEYQRILEHMILKAGKKIPVFNFFIIEEGLIDETNFILNLQSLQQYEFN